MEYWILLAPVVLIGVFLLPKILKFVFGLVICYLLD